MLSTLAERATLISTAENGTLMGTGVAARTSTATIQARTTPMNPPEAASELADHVHTANAKTVVTHVIDILGNVAIHPVDHRHDGNQSGGGQDNASKLRKPCATYSSEARWRRR